MSNIVEDRKNAVREEYGYFNDPQELFEYIIAKNKSAKNLDDQFKREEFLVKGCVSSLWLVPNFDKSANKCHFKSDADYIITRGVADLVCGLYDGLTPDEVLKLDPKFLEEIGISSHLSPNRRNGLSQLCGKIHDFAAACKNSQ